MVHSRVCIIAVSETIGIFLTAQAGNDVTVTILRHSVNYAFLSAPIVVITDKPVFMCSPLLIIYELSK